MSEHKGHNITFNEIVLSSYPIREIDEDGIALIDWINESSEQVLDPDQHFFCMTCGRRVTDEELGATGEFA